MKLIQKRAPVLLTETDYFNQAASVRKGRELGLQNSSYVRYQTRMWSEAYLAQKLLQEMIDSVKISDEENRYYYDQHKNNYGSPELDQVWDRVKRDALMEKRNQTIDAFLVQLADKYDIKVNQAVLDTFSTTNISMMVLKQHFPNRFAAPLVTPLNQLTEWQKLMSNFLPLK